MSFAQAVQYGASLTKLPARFIGAWWVAENGWVWPEDNNPGNISFQGEGIPTGGVFDGVTHVQENRVCVYDTWQHGVEAWATLINTPVSQKALTVDTAQLLECGDNIEAMCQKLGASNWASSHYVGSGSWDGYLVWEVYQDTKLDSFLAEQPASPAPAPAPVAPNRHQITVQKGWTLSRVSLDNRVPVKVLAAFNNITDPNFIEAGQVLSIPESYRVRPGDTLSTIAERFGTTVEKLAKTNAISNVNFIRSGDVLFV